MKKILILLLFCCATLFAGAQCQSAYTYTVSGASVNFTNTSTFSVTPTDVAWAWGDGSTFFANTLLPQQHTFQYKGTYTVCLIIGDSVSCNSTFCDTVQILSGPNPPCGAWFNAAQDTVSPYPVQFTVFPYLNNPAINKSNTWDFGDGSGPVVSTTSVTAHQYTASGTYSVCNTAISLYNDTCTYCKTINATPCIAQLQDSFSYSVLQGTANFTNYCSGATVPGYSWSFGDGSFSSLPNPSHTYQYNGNYTACLSYSDTLWGCVKSYCTSVSITNVAADPCIAMIAYEWDTVTPYTVHYQDISVSNITSRVWNFPNGSPATSTAQNPVVTYPNNIYTTTSLSVTNQSGVSCTSSVSFYPLPYCKYTKANFTLQPTGTPHVWTVNNNSVIQYPTGYYTWNWGDGNYSSGAAPSHTYTTPGWYTICLGASDINNCASNFCAHDTLYRFSADNSMITVNVADHTTTGVNNISLEEAGITLYPNPTNGQFTVGSKQLAIETAEVYNVFGQVVLSQSMKGEKGIDLTAQPAGIYWIKFFSEDKTITGKVILMK